MADIGFIGLGNMGAHMARNLIKAGHSLKVYDLNDETVRYVAQSGAQAAESAKEAASDVDFVVTMLPVGANVRNVLVDEGVIDAVRADTLLIDSSTIDVETARAMHEAAAGAGYQFLDAPVSGGVGVHVRRRSESICESASDSRRHGAQYRPLRRAGAGAGREDL